MFDIEFDHFVRDRGQAGDYLEAPLVFRPEKLAGTSPLDPVGAINRRKPVIFTNCRPSPSMSHILPATVRAPPVCIGHIYDLYQGISLQRTSFINGDDWMAFDLVQIQVENARRLLAAPGYYLPVGTLSAR